MATIITTSTAINLQTFNTGSGSNADDEVGGDGMADVDDASHGTHTRDSSDESTKIRADNGGTEEINTLIRIVLPTEDEMITRCLNVGGSGDAPRLTRIPESGLTLIGMDLFLSRTDSVGGAIDLQVFQLREDFSENECTWDSPNGSGTEEWTPGYADSAKVYHNSTATKTGITSTAQNLLKLDALIKVNKLSWGDKVLLYVRTSNASADFSIGSPNHSTAARRPVYKLKFTCDPPIPKIKVTPDTNGIDGIINITTPSGDAFLADGQYYGVWNTTASMTYNQSGKTSTFTDTGLTQINTNQINGALLAADGQDYFISLFAEDGISLIEQSGQSNIVYIKRPECSAALTNAAGVSDYAPEVGEEMTLTITPLNGLYSGKVKEFGVNWDSGTSDLDSDYSFYKLDTASSDAYVIKHKFHKVDTFQIKVKVKDQDGWSSDATATAGANTTVQESTPIANLSLSKDKVLQSKYLDRTTVVTANLSKSKAIGSNREIANYLFRYSSADNAIICTSGAINNDNSTFDDGAGKVSLQVVDAGFNFSETSFQIYGEASVTSIGTPIPDDSDDFDHYEYVTEKLFCPTTRLTEGTIKDTLAGQAGRGVSYHVYKSVEVIVCTAKDSDIDHQTRFILRRIASEDSAQTVINPAIYVGKDTDGNYNKLYSWGNYARIEDTGATADATSDYIELNSVTAANNSDEDWMNNGFFVGDIIKVQGVGNGTYAIPSYFKIASFTNSGGGNIVTATADRATIVTDSSLLNSYEKSYISTSVTTSSATSADIVLDNSADPTVTFAVYNTSNRDAAITIHGLVTDSDDTSWITNPSTEVSQTLESVVPNTLDLDSLIDNGHIAVLNSSINRAGGTSAQMPIGRRKYPIGVVRTKAGMPTLSLSLRVLTQTGLRRIFSVIEGDVYDYCFLDSDKIDSPSVAYKSYKLKADDGALNRDPAAASQYLSEITFTIMGEELQVE